MAVDEGLLLDYSVSLVQHAASYLAEEFGQLQPSSPMCFKSAAVKKLFLLFGPLMDSLAVARRKKNYLAIRRPHSGLARA